MTSRELGRTGIHISPIGLGCMQLSRVSDGKAGRGLAASMFAAAPQAHADAIVKAALDGGVTWFDTAESYGHGVSERALRTALLNAGVAPGEVVIATKWAPFKRTAGSIEGTIGDRLAALDPFPVDLHQIHMPFGSLSPIRSQLHAMARLVETGKIRAIGVSNFSARQMVSAHKTLADHGIPLASNQVYISLLRRRVEFNGVLEAARRLAITLIAYSPLSEGMLTGKFHDDRSLVIGMPWLRRTIMRINAKNLDRSAPLIDALRQIGSAHRASASQVALAWLIQNYGDIVVAIPGASKLYQAEEAAAAQTIRLTDDELAVLDNQSRPAQQRWL